MTAACAVLLTRDRQNPTWRPLAYACGYGLPILLVPLPVRELWFEDPGLPHHWISAVILGVGTLWALDLAAKRLGVSVSNTARAVAVLVVAGLCSLAAPGILAAFFLIVLGYASHHWQLIVVGLVALPLYVFEYYYGLEIHFMTKSGVLAGTGALLLLARWAMVHSRWFESAEEGT